MISLNEITYSGTQSQLQWHVKSLITYQVKQCEVDCELSLPFELCNWLTGMNRMEYGKEPLKEIHSEASQVKLSAVKPRFTHQKVTVTLPDADLKPSVLSPSPFLATMLCPTGPWLR